MVHSSLPPGGSRPRPSGAALFLTFLLFSLVLPTLAGAADFPPWAGEEEVLESFLREAEVAEREDITRGVTKPQRLGLEQAGRTAQAVWKPLRPGYYDGYWESWQAEVMAYRLARWLGMNVVPPTVERKLGAIQGSLQYWVNGFRMYEEVEGKAPRTPSWSHQLARMKFFDNLMHNRDRNAGNFLVDDQWNIVLIDHSRAILHERKLLNGKNVLPSSFDRNLVERLRELDLETAQELLGDLLKKNQLKALIKRSEALLEYVEECEAEQGDSIYFD